MHDTVKQLKKLQSIAPDKDYAAKSRLLIMSHRKPAPAPSLTINPLKDIFRFGLAMTFSAALIVLVVGGASFLEQSALPLKLAGLDLNTLKAEAEGLNIDINMKQIEYYQEAPHTFKTALNQTIEDNPVYFKEVILNKETDAINLEDPTNDKIDDALNEIMM